MELVEVLVFFLAIGPGLYLAYTRLRAARQPREEHARKQAQADAAPYNLAARSACLLCSDEGNHPEHSCRYTARVEKRSYKSRGRRGRRSRYGSPYYERWTGLVYQVGAAQRAYRRCYHGHREQLDALYCARRMLRRFQVGERPPSIPGLTEGTWRAMVRKADYRCSYCGDQFLLTDLHKEHKVPLSRGGSNTRGNIVPSCGPCNYRKGRLTAEEFLGSVGQRKSRKQTRRRPGGRFSDARLDWEKDG